MPLLFTLAVILTYTKWISSLVFIKSTYGAAGSGYPIQGGISEVSVTYGVIPCKGY